MSSEWQCMYEDAEAEVKRLRDLWSKAESRLADCESSLVQSQAENDRLRAELEAGSADARRYRWLRDEAPLYMDEGPLVFMADDMAVVTGELDGSDLDAAIDSAMGVES